MQYKAGDFTNGKMNEIFKKASGGFTSVNITHKQLGNYVLVKEDNLNMLIEQILSLHFGCAVDENNNVKSFFDFSSIEDSEDFVSVNYANSHYNNLGVEFDNHFIGKCIANNMLEKSDDKINTIANIIQGGNVIFDNFELFQWSDFDQGEVDKYFRDMDDSDIEGVDSLYGYKQFCDLSCEMKSIVSSKARMYLMVLAKKLLKTNIEERSKKYCLACWEFSDFLSSTGVNVNSDAASFYVGFEMRNIGLFDCSDDDEFTIAKSSFTI